MSVVYGFVKITELLRNILIQFIAFPKTQRDVFCFSIWRSFFVILDLSTERHLDGISEPASTRQQLLWAQTPDAFSAPNSWRRLRSVARTHRTHRTHSYCALAIPFLRFPLSPVAIAIAIAISSFFLLSLGSRIKFSVPALAFTDFS